MTPQECTHQIQDAITATAAHFFVVGVIVATCALIAVETMLVLVLTRYWKRIIVQRGEP